MKIAFVSNYLNHHQTPFCSVMWQTYGKDFCFISTESMEEERLRMGWKADEAPPYELRSYESAEKYGRAQAIINNCDVVILGSAKDQLIRRRLKKGKLTFRYSERLYKTGTPASRWLRDAISAWMHHGRYRRYPLHMLCASAFTAADAGRFGNYIDRCYKWGYFPQTVHYQPGELAQKKENEIPVILWAGRFLDWKHPDDAVRVACRLKEDGYRFRMEIIGNGLMEDEIAQQVEACGVSDCVKLLGSMSPEQVRCHMERANIYLFTSDRNEGWGAVLNESMNSGCAVVASHLIGSVPFLVKDGENGLIYRSGDADMLYEKVKYLLDQPERQRELGMAAYRTITEEWNVRVAALRLIRLSQCLLNGEEVSELFGEGPCSCADRLSDDWLK